MDPMRALLLGVVAPGALALIVALALGGWRRDASSRFGATAAVALAAAYVLTWALVLGLPELVPVDATQASPWFALLAGALAWPLSKVPRIGRVLASVLLGVGVGAWLTLPLVPHALTGGEAALQTIAIAATFVALDLGLAYGLAKIDARGGAVATVLLVTGASLAVLFSDVASLAQVTGGLAAGIGALIVFGFWRKSAAELASASLVVAAILTSNLWSGKLYASGDALVIAVLVLAPLVLVAAARWLARPRKAWLALALPAALIVVPVAAVTALAASVYFARADVAADVQPATTDDGYDPSYGY